MRWAAGGSGLALPLAGARSGTLGSVLDHPAGVARCAAPDQPPTAPHADVCRSPRQAEQLRETGLRPGTSEPGTILEYAHQDRSGLGARYERGRAVAVVAPVGPVRAQIPSDPLSRWPAGRVGFSGSVVPGTPPGRPDVIIVLQRLGLQSVVGTWPWPAALRGWVSTTTSRVPAAAPARKCPAEGLQDGRRHHPPPGRTPVARRPGRGRQPGSREPPSRRGTSRRVTPWTATPAPGARRPSRRGT